MASSRVYTYKYKAMPSGSPQVLPKVVRSGDIHLGSPGVLCSAQAYLDLARLSDPFDSQTTFRSVTPPPNPTTTFLRVWGPS